MINLHLTKETVVCFFSPATTSALLSSLIKRITKLEHIDKQPHLYYFDKNADKNAAQLVQISQEWALVSLVYTYPVKYVYGQQLQNKPYTGYHLILILLSVKPVTPSGLQILLVQSALGAV